MPYFKESSGGSPAGIIIESKEQYGPQGIEAKDTINADAVQEAITPISTNWSVSWTCWLISVALLLLVIAITYVLIQRFGDGANKQIVDTTK